MASSRLDANMPTSSSIAGSTGALVISTNALRFKSDTSSNISVQENAKSQEFEYVSSFYSSDSTRTRLTGLDLPINNYDLANKEYVDGIYEKITVSGSTVSLSGPSIVVPNEPNRPDSFNPLLSFNTSSMNPTSICFDTNNNFYISINFLTTITSTPIFNRDGTFAYNIINTTNTTNVGFILKYDENGISTCYTIVGNNNIFMADIKTDYSNNLYFAGSYAITFNVCNFSSGVAPSVYFLPKSSLNNNLALIKWSSTGFVISVSFLENLTSSTSLNTSLYFDSKNNLYVSPFLGRTTNVYNFSSTPGSFSSVFLLTSNASTGNSFIIKYNSQGTALSFTKLESTASTCSINSISIDNNDTLYCCGTLFIGTLNVYNFTSTNTLTLVFTVPNLMSSQQQIVFAVKWISDIASSWTGIRGFDPILKSCVTDSANSFYMICAQDTVPAFVYSFTNTNTLGSSLFLLPSIDESIYPNSIIKWDGNGIALGFTILINLFPSSLCVDVYNNLYVSGATSLPTTVIYNFYTGSSATFSSGWVSQLTVNTTGTILIKWSPSGIGLSCTNLPIANNACIVSDRYSNIHISSSSGTTTIPVRNFYNSPTLPPVRFRFSQTSRCTYYIKWLSNGKVDLGSYKKPFYINLPTPTSIYRKKLFLNTQGYNYYINYVQNTTMTSNISNTGSIQVSNVGEVDLIWLNGVWALSENLQNTNNQVKNNPQITSGPSMNLPTGIVLNYIGTSLNSTNPVRATFTTISSYGSVPPTGTANITINSEGTYKISSQLYYNTPVSGSTITATLAQYTTVIDNISETSRNNARGLYATFLLRSAYTGPVLQIRRPSDNATQDVFATSGGFLTISGGTAYSSWTAGTAFVAKWYDQSTLGNHAIALTSGEQPILLASASYPPAQYIIDSSTVAGCNLVIPTNTIPVGVLNGPYSIVIRHGTTGNGVMLAGGIATNNNANGVSTAGGATAYRNFKWAVNDFDIGTSAEVVAGNSFAFTFDSTIRKGYINNTLRGTNGNVGLSTGTFIYYQYFFTFAGIRANCQMIHAYIFGSALPESDIRILNQYQPILFSEVSASTGLTLMSGQIISKFAYGQTIGVNIQCTNSTANISASGSQLNIMRLPF